MLGEQRRWHREHYRAECRDGSLVLDAETIEIHRGDSASEAVAVPADHPRHGHRKVLTEFADWLNGGPEPATALRDNLLSLAAVFAARDMAAAPQLTATLALVARAPAATASGSR